MWQHRYPTGWCRSVGAHEDLLRCPACAGTQITCLAQAIQLKLSLIALFIRIIVSQCQGLFFSLGANCCHLTTFFLLPPREGSCVHIALRVAPDPCGLPHQCGDGFAWDSTGPSTPVTILPVGQYQRLVLAASLAVFTFLRQVHPACLPVLQADLPAQQKQVLSRVFSLAGV